MTNRIMEETGSPLWSWLRRTKTIDGGSKIEKLLSGAKVGGRYCANWELSYELLYRFVRRYPRRILVCDIYTIGIFGNRYRADLTNRVPHDYCALGFLEAGDAYGLSGKIVSTGGHYTNSRYEHCINTPERFAALQRYELLKKPSNKKRMALMSDEEKRAFILIVELKELLYGKARLFRPKNIRAQRSSGPSLTAG